MNLYGYDLETFVNCFLFAGKFLDSPDVQVFEISDRMNQRDALLSHLSYLQNSGAWMYGFNNIRFDYQILHHLLLNPFTFDAKTAYLEAQKVIKNQGPFGAFSLVPLRDRIIPQVDLFKIHHFDNPAKSTTLKALQFAMRSESVEDLPFDPHTPLTFAQMDQLKAYNVHDVLETEKFCRRTMPFIKMREELLTQGILSGDVMNWSDVKLGAEYLVKRIGRSKCYSGSTPKQTPRTSVEFRDIILPKISFKTDKFSQVLDWFKQQTVWFASSERPKLQTELAGLQFHFGVGGVHASVENKQFTSNETHVIRDIDVSGMYVTVGYVNEFYPEHLGKDFVVAYKQLKKDRDQYPKASNMSKVLKLGGNGAFGNSGNEYSCFFDPKYLLTITINGQLQLLQLVEHLSLIPGLQIIQGNTDGITVYMPRDVEPFFNLWKSEWEAQTNLKLEDVEFNRMWIRDVNNYLAIDTKGNVKRKGAYWYPITDDDYWGGSGSNWAKDFSNVAAPKGVEQCLLTGCFPEEVVKILSDKFDFMLRYKTPSGAKVFIGDKEMSKTVRYYVSTKGEKMQKISMPKGEIGTWKRKNGLKDEEYQKILATLPPGAWDERIHTKNKSKYEKVITSIESGRLVKCCNKASDFDWNDVDFDYYAQEIRKLLIGSSQ